MTDFVDGLEEDLVDAARRQQQARTAAAGVRRRLSGRTLALIATGLLVGGTATAAVVTRESEPSGPLVSDGERDYRVAIRPDLRAGQIGWCTEVSVGSGSETKGCFPAPSSREPQLLSALGMYGRTSGISVALATAGVPVVRLGERRVRTRADARVPFGWRAAVVLSAATSPQDGSQFPPIAENAEGEPLPIPRSTGHVSGARSRKVRARDRSPRCSVGTASGFEAVYTRAATTRPRADGPTAAYPSYFSCTSTTFRIDGRRAGLTAAILEPAPGTARPVAPRALGLSVRPLDGAWLVVTGGRAAERLALLDRLRPERRSP